jgi:thioredoxin
MNSRTPILAAALLLMAAGAFTIVSSLKPAPLQTTQMAAANASQSYVVEVTSANYKTEVEQSSLPVIIDFSAPWCGPCRAFAPTFAAAARDYAGKVKFVHIDVDASPDLAAKFGVSRIPTIAFMKSPKDGPGKATTSTGSRGLDALKQFVEDSLK